MREILGCEEAIYLELALLRDTRWGTKCLLKSFMLLSRCSVKFVSRMLGVAFFCTALLPTYAKAQQAKVAELNTYLDQAHQAGMLNGNVLVVDHGKVILSRAIGFADGVRTLPLTLSDRFDIGSIAKEFDAVGILILSQQGKLSLSDPVSKFIPDLPPWSKTVTIDDLLHYTSGLPEVDWNTVNSDADDLRNLRALKQLDFPAGTHYAYNNNTFLRRRVIEKVSGMSFAEFLKTQEFPNAGIRDAVIDPTDATPRVAKSFDANFKQDPMTVDITGWTALTVDDFLRWSNCITNFCLITPNSTRQIVTTQNAKWQTGLGHGDMVGGRLVRHVHDGNDHNFEALLMVGPAKGRTIILLTSQNRDHVYAMAAAINAILDGKPYLPLSQSKEE
jgi:D-alanyl-D-alanine carboxypeptidase